MSVKGKETRQKIASLMENAIEEAAKEAKRPYKNKPCQKCEELFYNAYPSEVLCVKCEIIDQIWRFMRPRPGKNTEEVAREVIDYTMGIMANRYAEVMNLLSEPDNNSTLDQS